MIAGVKKEVNSSDEYVVEWGIVGPQQLTLPEKVLYMQSADKKLL